MKGSGRALHFEMVLPKKKREEPPSDAGAAESARLLEALYELQEVDLSSVRKIGGRAPIVQQPSLDREEVEPILLPWIRSHGGIASQLELEDCLEEGSGDFSILFVRVASDLYCEDPELAHFYQLLVDRALTYFYRPGLSYTLSELTFLDLFVRRVLILSPLFRARKEGKERVVRRSIGCLISPPQPLR